MKEVQSLMLAAETHALDVSELLLKAYEIGVMINHSREVAEYLRWKQAVERSEEIQEAVRLLARKKEKFRECERFGRYHPDYHHALNEVKEAERRLDQFEAVRQYKAAEKELDHLLYDLSKTIAHAVSESILVPSNDPMPARGGCGAGCACKCG